MERHGGRPEGAGPQRIMGGFSFKIFFFSFWAGGPAVVCVRSVGAVSA